MKDKVVVIGGSGFLGSHLADALTAGGYAVTVFDLRPSPWRQPGQEMILGDVRDEKAVQEAVTGARFVYHLAGIADIGQAAANPRATVVATSCYAQRRPEERPPGIEVRSGKGWTLVGNCGLFGIEWNNRAAEFGIFIGDKSVWGKGYGTDAARLVLRHGFETLNLNRIFLRVYEDNPRAMHTYEKAGFVPEGRMRQAVYRNGEYKDVLLMSTLRSEWDSSKG